MLQIKNLWISYLNQPPVIKKKNKLFYLLYESSSKIPRALGEAFDIVSEILNDFLLKVKLSI